MHPAYILISASVSVLLGNAEGVYHLESGTYPECTQRPFIQVHYDAARESVYIERLDRAGNRRGWQWLNFGPLDGKRQQSEGFFTDGKFERYTVKKSGKKIRLRRETKSCNMKFFCGRWKHSTEVTLSGSNVLVGLLAGTQQCVYRYFGSKI